MPQNRCTLLLAATLAAAACAQQPASVDGAPPAPGTFDSPQGVAASERWVLVANSAFRYVGGKSSWGLGSVTVVDRRTRRIAGRIPTSALNPQRVAVRGDRAYVISSGRIALDASGLATAESEGAIDVIDLAPDPPRLAASLALPLAAAGGDRRIGAYGAIALAEGGKLAFLGSGTRGDVFSVELDPLRLRRGPERPIVLFATPDGGNGLTTPVARGGELLVANMSSDELCASDDLAGDLERRRCTRVGVSSLLEAPLDVAPLPDGDLLVLMSVANAIYRVSTAGLPFVVDASFARTGLAANRVLVHRGFAYVVNSMSNNLQRIELATRESRLPFSVLPLKSNPYDAVITEEPEGDVAWVTLFGSHQLALIELASGKLLGLVPGAAGADARVEARAYDAHPADARPRCPDGGAATVGVGAVVSASYGEGGGNGKDRLPAVIQGAPSGGGAGGSTDVLSLGVGGELVVDFGPYDIVDGPGPDFIVFENAFLVGPYAPFAEPALVAASASDTMAQSFVEFPCDLKATQGDPAKGLWPYPGCAGVKPTLAGPASCVSPADSAAAGGDAFDLATVGLKRARYLRLRDAGLSTVGASGSKGFDLDAVVLVNYEKR